jgi:hypothetical protein
MTLKKLLELTIIFLFFWIPFEWFIIKWLPISLEQAKLIRVIIDAIPLLFFLFYFSISQVKITQHNLFLLVGCALIMTGLFIGDLLHLSLSKGYLFQIGVFLRFIPLVWLIPYLNNEKFGWEAFIKFCRWMLFFFLLLGILEFVLEETARSFFLPQHAFFDIKGADLPVALREEKYYQASATFINTIDFCFYLLPLLVVYLFTKTKVTLWICLVILATGIIVWSTHSFAGLLLFFIVLVAWLSHLNLKLRLGYYATIGLVAICAAVLFSEQIKSYANNSIKYSRLGILVKTAPAFLSSGPQHVIFGLGSNQEFVYQTITSYGEVPKMLFYDKNFSSLRDVYWVAMLLHYGIFGLSIIFFLLYRLYVLAKRLSDQKKHMVQTLLLLAFVLGFVNQPLDVKSFSFLFWVVMGLMFQEMRQQGGRIEKLINVQAK